MHPHVASCTALSSSLVAVACSKHSLPWCLSQKPQTQNPSKGFSRLLNTKGPWLGERNPTSCQEYYPDNAFYDPTAVDAAEVPDSPFSDPTAVDAAEVPDSAVDDSTEVGAAQVRGTRLETNSGGFIPMMQVEASMAYSCQHGQHDNSCTLSWQMASQSAGLSLRASASLPGPGGLDGGRRSHGGARTSLTCCLNPIKLISTVLILN